MAAKHTRFSFPNVLQALARSAVSHDSQRCTAVFHELRPHRSASVPPDLSTAFRPVSFVLRRLRSPCFTWRTLWKVSGFPWGRDRGLYSLVVGNTAGGGKTRAPTCLIIFFLFLFSLPLRSSPELELMPHEMQSRLTEIRDLDVQVEGECRLSTRS